MNTTVLECWVYLSKISWWPETEEECKAASNGFIKFVKLGSGEVVAFDHVYGNVFREADYIEAAEARDRRILPQFSDEVSRMLERIAKE
ncbi:hypothetical protein OTAKU_00430 [Serratia phage vB_SmaM-Otaku]|uniref:Uncharacterized protein n=1 Tax=Serratia phage vB_SmaM-Otaku TaxID=2932867 RepID=A0AAE9KRK7_9CAUD|nr:hypothetical protein PF631_gp43 [Serratia phage vB_SmaM-Otaku]UPU16032.1 hypothetical protein OTAKU_00430 [Serratia phage vB_SmaM-Otaku]